MKKYYVMAGFLALMLMTTSVFAEESGSGAGSGSDTATVAKDLWITQMVKLLPPEVCKDKAYLLTCFKIPADECLKIVAASTQTCSDKLKSQIPDMMNTASAEEWGGKIGECAGEAYATDHADKKVDSEECNDDSDDDDDE